VVVSGDQRARDQALERLMQYAEIIAARRMSKSISRGRAPSSICQSVFVDLVKADGCVEGKPKHFENEQAVLRYLKRCIQNKIAEEARKRGRSPRSVPIGSGDCEFDPPAKEACPDGMVYHSELAASVAEFESSLKPKDLRILRLRQEMKSWDQIS